MHILGLGGSTKPDSCSERALFFAAKSAREEGASVELLTGQDLVLPIYDTEHTERAAAATRLLRAIECADGLIIASPAYHGSVSGMIKNALDYVEDLRNADRAYLDGMPVGCIAAGSGWQAAVSTLSSLRVTVHALRGWPTPLGVAINSTAPTFDVSGNCVDETIGAQLSTMTRQVVRFVWAHHADKLASEASPTECAV